MPDPTERRLRPGHRHQGTAHVAHVGPGVRLVGITDDAHFAHLVDRAATDLGLR